MDRKNIFNSPYSTADSLVNATLKDKANLSLIKIYFQIESLPNDKKYLQRGH